MYFLDQQQERARRIALLDGLLQETSKFTLNKFGVKSIVMAEGNVLSNCLVIGEALGREEDEQKRIFIGRSGQIVRRMLSTVGVENSVFLVNTIPWRPKDNRTPTINEVKTMSFFLKEIIKILNPEAIICMGSTAKSFFYYNKGAQLSAELLSTYHPAYLLRTSSVGVAEDMFSTILSFSRLVNDCGHDNYVFKQDVQCSD